MNILISYLPFLLALITALFAISMAVRALTNKGDAILIQQPVYYPFKAVIVDNERVCINNPLVLKEGRYEMDFGDMEQKIIENQVKMFILSVHMDFNFLSAHSDFSAPASIFLFPFPQKKFDCFHDLY